MEMSLFNSMKTQKKSNDNLRHVFDAQQDLYIILNQESAEEEKEVEESKVESQENSEMRNIFDLSNAIA